MKRKPSRNPKARSLTNPPEPVGARHDEVKSFRNTLDEETDRGCALMAAAYLDSQLEELVRASMVEDQKVADELLSQSKPLATLSSRIDLAYLLGHISKKLRRDIHLIRKIRNDFGHNSNPLDFDHPSIAARCRDLFHCIRRPNDPPRKRFTNTVLSVLGCIHASLANSKRPSIKSDLPITEEFRETLRELAKAEFTALQKTPSSKPVS